jgi:formylglycine-generating enzyme
MKQMRSHPFLLFVLTAALLTLTSPGDGSTEEKDFVNSIGMEFVRIPAGRFEMGSPPGEAHRDPSETRHPVVISHPFYMQTTEVTLKQWRAVMGRKLFGRGEDSGQLPVTRISWYDSKDFIARLNVLGEGHYRMPTEAEWEYAARAGSTTAYSWGETISCDQAMFENNSMKSGKCVDFNRSRGLASDGPAPVKSYPPNAWGLYDMHGNVWEWCKDWFGDYATGPVTDPAGPADGEMRVRRGGSWFRYGYSCRSANRAEGHPASRYQTTGLRVVRDIE